MHCIENIQMFVFETESEMIFARASYLFYVNFYFNFTARYEKLPLEEKQAVQPRTELGQAVDPCVRAVAPEVRHRHRRQSPCHQHCQGCKYLKPVKKYPNSLP